MKNGCPFNEQQGDDQGHGSQQEQSAAEAQDSKNNPIFMKNIET
jgi:hypothetical protein